MEKILESDCPFENNIDLVNPYRMPLSVFYKRSFPYRSMKTRWPETFKKIMDNIKDDTEMLLRKYGEECGCDITYIITEIQKLLDEIQSNKRITPIISSTARSDIPVWNQMLTAQLKEVSNVTFFNTTFLFAECYLYRRLMATIESTQTLTNYDPFQRQKQEEFFLTFASILEVGKYIDAISNLNMCDIDVKEHMSKIIKLELWGNKCDLSLSRGEVVAHITHPLDLLKTLEKNVIANDFENIWRTISCQGLGEDTLAIILDNTGYELFLDYCLADFLISQNVVKKVYFYPKAIPWFISDVTPFDLEWTIKTICASDEDILKKLGQRWQRHFQNGEWKVTIDDFFNTPCPYYEMEGINKKLYDDLSLHKLVIFKGDLNYRKLIGDVKWFPSTPFREALQGFHPTNLCALRVIKSDSIAGVPRDVHEQLDQSDPNWYYGADYGLIQYDGDF